jgi:NTE family protein
MIDQSGTETMSTSRSRKKLGLALGGGGALGLAHIGVLRVLEENGLAPDVVAGTSIGAVMGAAYVFDKLERVEAAARAVNWLEVMRLTDLQFGKSGLLRGDAISREVRKYIGNATFDETDRPFAVVAADLATDEEVTIRSGSVADGIRASISLPGIFAPVSRDGRLLIDGGMKNPVPVSTCHDLGADVVVAVDVTGDYAGQAANAGIVPGETFSGGIMEVITTTMAMVMRQVARARFATNPPDVLIVPKIGHVRPFAFGRGMELITAGRDATIDVLSEIETAIRT